jgi:hypothetical protein
LKKYTIWQTWCETKRSGVRVYNQRHLLDGSPTSKISTEWQKKQTSSHEFGRSLVYRTACAPKIGTAGIGDGWHKKVISSSRRERKRCGRGGGAAARRGARMSSKLWHESLFELFSQHLKLLLTTLAWIQSYDFGIYRIERFFQCKRKYFCFQSALGYQCRCKFLHRWRWNSR